MTRQQTGSADLTRRDFLVVSGLAAGVSVVGPSSTKAAEPKAQACIQIMLTGGPSQLETWDPKPNAPSTIRGPFRATQTKLPGVYFSEHFPRLAARADRLAILRTLFHEEAPIHETGQQLLQTGHLANGQAEWPHFGGVLGALHPSRSELPPWVILPGPLQEAGARLSHGQGLGFIRQGPTPLMGTSASLSTHAVNIEQEPTSLRAHYGEHSLGQNCLRAGRLIEQGVRVVTVNMFETVFGQVSWDCHANGNDLNSTLADYGKTLCPMLDQALSALLDDLHDRGMLDSTLIVCAGEFGRTPHLNRQGGRDHWPGVWSGLFAGGGVRGGQVVGATDAHAGAPKDRPIRLAEVTASVYHALGIRPTTLVRGADGRAAQLVEHNALAELH